MAFNALDIGYAKYQRRWTKSAIECYKIGCWCEKCRCIPDDMKQKCRMKAAVLELVRLFGKPKEKPEWMIFEREGRGVNLTALAILEGANTREEIAEMLNYEVKSVKFFLQILYKLAIKEGYTFKTRRGNLKELCAWLRETKERVKDEDNPLHLHEFCNLQ